MIHLITSREEEYNEEELLQNGIKLAKGKEVFSWFNTYQGDIQLDTETNVVRDIYGWKRNRKGKKGWSDPVLDEHGNKIPEERECYVVQVGDRDGENQFIFDMPGLSGKKYSSLITILKSNNTKLIHNGLFDYTVIKWCFGIDITNIRDTFLMSKILVTGIEARDLEYGHNSLAGCAKRLLGIDLSKAAQTTFDGNPMDVEQIRYAAIDVAILGKVEEKLSQEIDKFGLENVVKLESAFSRVIGDSMCENFYLNTEEWDENIRNRKEEVDGLHNKLNELIKEYFYSEAVEEGFIQKSNHYAFTWTGRKLKHDLLRLVYPDLPADATTLPKYKEALNSMYDRIEEGSGEDPSTLELYLNKNYDDLEDYFINNYHDKLVELGIYTKAGTMLINLNSPEQTTRLFKLIDPAIEDSGADTVKKINHPIAKTYRDYSKASKLLTSYGENFYDWVSPDGQFRASGYQQILATGRCSLKHYQLLPGKSIYRNPFKPNDPLTGTREDGYKWKVIGCDYSSQEICIMATFAGEDAMLDAIKNGYDLHSLSASLLFPEKWVELGGDKKPKGKPDNPELLKFRAWSKAITFGLAYGLSAVGLADQLDIQATTSDLMEFYKKETEEFLKENDDAYELYCIEYKKGRRSKTAVKEFLKREHNEGRYLPEIVTGDDLIQKFYNAYPKLKNFLVSSGEAAKTTLKSITPDPFGRIRFFITPDYESGYGAIERAGTNSRIQGSAANMSKYAAVLLKKHIEENNLQDKLKFALMIHDELQVLVREDFTKEGLKIVKNCMEKAGEVVLGNRLQKTDGDISDYWVK